MEIKNEARTEEKLNKALAPYKEEAESIIEDEDRFERIIQRLEKKLKLIPEIGESLSDIACMVSLVRSYIRKEYTDIPLGTIIGIVALVLYVVSPIDLIPDFIPGAGLLDDAALLALELKQIHSDVEEYKKWRIDNNR